MFQMENLCTLRNHHVGENIDAFLYSPQRLLNERLLYFKWWPANNNLCVVKACELVILIYFKDAKSVMLGLKF